MKLKNRNIKLVFLLVAVVLFSCKEKSSDLAIESKQERQIEKLPYFNSPDFTPRWHKVEHKIPDFSFINQDSLVITNKTFEGKIYVADFFFTTCPGICPKLEKNMSLLQDKYFNDNDIMLLSHTVMPWVDTVDKLKDYAQHNDINSGKWHLITGERDAIYNIARNGYFADEDFKKTQDESDFIHTENFVLVDKQGYIRGVYNGTIELDIKRLQGHIDILKREG